MNDVFKVGDVVALKSGSPKMTVCYSDKESTSVRYYEPGLNKISENIALPTAVFELVQVIEAN